MAAKGTHLLLLGRRCERDGYGTDVRLSLPLPRERGPFVRSGAGMTFWGICGSLSIWAIIAGFVLGRPTWILGGFVAVCLFLVLAAVWPGRVSRRELWVLEDDERYADFEREDFWWRT